MLVTSRNGDRKIMESIRITSRPPLRISVEPVEPVQMNNYQSYIYRKDLSWLHFDHDIKVQERQQVKGQQSYISVFVAYLPIPSRS